MALIRNPRPDKYGGVLVSPDGWVTGFSRAGGVRESYHFVGVQVAEARAFLALPDGVPAESVNAVYPSLIAAHPRSVLGVIGTWTFRDIGTPADYLQTAVELAELEGDRLTAGARVSIAASARVDRSAIWDDVTIGEGAELRECIVTDGVRIPPGAAFVRRAIVQSADGAGLLVHEI
jgi:NDP-sugar pyrophosphorylase family protein